MSRVSYRVITHSNVSGKIVWSGIYSLHSYTTPDCDVTYTRIVLNVNEKQKSNVANDARHDSKLFLVTRFANVL